MSELNIPDSWAETKYKDATNVIYGKGLPEGSRKEGIYPVLSSAGVVGTHKDFLIEGPAVITGRKGTLGKPHFVQSNSWVIDTAFAIKPHKGLLAKFVYWQIQSIDLSELQESTAIPSLSREALYATPLPIPPLAEQERIIQKIESCFENIDTTEANLTKIEALLEKYRESLLAKAFRGELVTQDSSDEPASVLLKKIKQTTNSKSDEFYTLTQDDIPYELPKDWTWCTLPEVGVLARGKSKHRPRNDKKLFDGKYPFIQTGDVSNADMYVTAHEQTYNEFGLAQSRLFPEGTLCITIAANIGKTAILTYPACFPDSIVGFTPHKGYLTPEFVLFFFEYIQNNLEKIAPGAAQKNINLEILSKIPFPLPPLRVQKEIERRIRESYLFLSEEKASMKIRKFFLEKLKRAILQKAFEGQLVEQIPSEGTGHDLLDQILKDQKSTSESKTKTSTKTTNSTKPTSNKHVSKREVTIIKLMDIIQYFEKHPEGKITSDLLTSMGYQSDHDSIEKFYLEIRELINSKKLILTDLKEHGLKTGSSYRYNPK